MTEVESRGTVGALPLDIAAMAEKYKASQAGHDWELEQLQAMVAALLDPATRSGGVDQAFGAIGYVLAQVAQARGSVCGITAASLDMSQTLSTNYSSAASEDLNTILSLKKGAPSSPAAVAAAKGLFNNLKTLKSVMSLPSKERPWVTDDTASGIVKAVDGFFATFDSASTPDAMLKEIRVYNDDPSKHPKAADGTDLPGGTGAERLRRLSEQLNMISTSLSSSSSLFSSTLSTKMGEETQVEGTVKAVLQSLVTGIGKMVSAQRSG